MLSLHFFGGGMKWAGVDQEHKEICGGRTDEERLYQWISWQNKILSVGWGRGWYSSSRQSDVSWTKFTLSVSLAVSLFFGEEESLDTSLWD